MAWPFVVRSSLPTCATPRLAMRGPGSRAAAARGHPGTVDVTLVSDGLPAHTSTALFTYTRHSVVDSITPGRSSHLGGELVSVRGAFFDASAKLRCAFGGLRVPAVPGGRSAAARGALLEDFG